ncbi:PR domain zinc finger protein 2 [Melozone crissalis]|uniref:PR domain zinc finger protein 2 n=1 Tax=Melozone crissalis TaxID=40204 RepID=UPI0023DC40DD|nr:PR domain zinc finger protein 2 [Melozone crissalis]
MNQNTSDSPVAVETLDDVPEHVLRGLPEDVRLFPSAVDKTRLGVWATKSILKGKKFGPFVGDKKKRSQVKSNVYMWEVYYPNLGWMCVDATDPEKGNWLRYINWARSGKEQNLFPLEINRTIYYKSLKPIAAGEELLVWYNGEDDPAIAAAIEEERASARSRRHSPKARRGKKKTQEGKNKGKKAADTKQKKTDLDSTSADMRDSKEGHKEEDETPSVSAVLSLEQTAVIQEMVNQDVLPKLMVPSPTNETQVVTEDKQGEAINCASDYLDEDEEEDEEEEDEEEIEDTNMPKENAEMPLICEEKLDSMEEQKSTSEESPESSPKKKLVVKIPKAEGESNGDVQETFMFPCQHCERKFTTKQGLERHMHIHISTLSHAFKCRYCGKAFGTQINRRRHERRHEAGPKRKPFLTLTSSQHLDNVADNQVIVDDGLKDDLNVSSLVQDSVVLDSEKVSQEMSNSAFAEENKEPKELHPCKYCKKVFGTHTNMRRHQRRVHERHLIPKGVRRKGFFTEEPPLPTEPAPAVQSVYIASTEIEEEGEGDDVYLMDISSNISENLNYYIDGKIQSNSSTSNCDVIQMESNSADLYGLNCIISPVTVEISTNLKVTQTHVNEPPKEPSSSGSSESKKRRTASPPLVPKIKTEIDPEPITPTSSLNLPLSISTESLTFHKEKGVYLSSKLKQLLQTQDSKKITPSSEIPKIGPSVTSSSVLPPVSSRFKRRTSSPPSSPQHSPVLRDFVKSGEGKTVWNDNIRSSKMPKLESHSNSPAWSLTAREDKETLSPHCFEEYKISKDWTATPTFGNVCNQQPLDLSSGMKQRSDVKSKTQVPWESVLDLSVHKKPCSDAEMRECKENSTHPTCSGVKKKKPTTCMLQKVLLNEYNGTDAAPEQPGTDSAGTAPQPPAEPDGDPAPSAAPATDTQPLSSSAASPVPAVPPAAPAVCQLPPLLTPTNPPSPPPCLPVLTVATSPPPLLPTMPLPIPDVSASATNTSSCPSPLSNTTTQSPLPVLSPTVSPSPSPVPSVEPLISAASPGPPNLSSSSSSSSSSSFSSSSSSSSPSPPPLSVVSSVVSSADNLESSLPIIKQEEAESEQQKAREEPHTSGESGVVQETFNKSFVCNVCESPFLSIKDLTKHLSIHAEEWPFKCEFCVQLFRDKTDLSEHRFLLHGVGNIFVCSVCKKEFAFLCNLQQHQRDLHPDKECTHHEFESGTLRPQNFTDPSKANAEHMQNLPEDSLEPSKEEEDEDLNDSSEELYTTIKIMASGVKSKDPDVRMGLNQHYPSFKPPPFQYHHRNPMGIGVTATNFTTHNIPQTFTTAIRCTKCGKSVDNMPELHKHILACASASDKKRYTPKKNPVPLKQTVQPKNGMVVIAGPGKNAFRRMGQPKRLNFNVEISKMSSNKLKISALKKKNQLVQKAILQKKKSAQQKAELKNNPSETDSHICPYCNREFTYIGSLNKHASYSCPKKPISPSSKKNSSKKSAASSPANSDKGSSQRRRTADAEIKMQSTQPHLGKTRARTSGPAQLQLPSASFKSKQNVKFVPSMRSKKPNSSSSLRNSSPVRVSKMSHVDGKKTKVVSKNNSSGISSKASRKLHVRIQRNSKAVLPSKSAVASKKKADRFSVKSRERIGGPITRSLQQAANAEAAENKRDESSTKQELKDFRLRVASRCPSSSSHSPSSRQCKKPSSSSSHFLKE